MNTTQSTPNGVEPKTVLEQFTVVERAIIYARVSTDEQAESGTSIDNQVEKSLAYAAANNLHVPPEFIFKEDYTGKVLERPELDKARDLLRAGRADHLIVYKANRLDRSELGVNLLILLMQELKPLGVALHYSEINKRIDLHNVMEAFMYGSFAGMLSGEDHRETVKKLHDGRINRAKSGYVVVHGHPPYGYRVVKRDDKKWYLEIEDSEAAIVKLIFEWYLYEALTLYGIADRLNGMGIPTRSGSSPWRKVTIRRILINETCCGTWHYGKENKQGRTPKESHIPVAVPAIVSRETWELAQGRLENNKRFSPRNRKYHYLMASRVICGDCGYRMTGTTAKVNYYYYRCPSGLNRDCGRECHNPGFVVGVVDTKVWDKLEEVSRDKDKLIDGLRGYQILQESKVEPIKRELTYVEDLIKEKNAEWESAYLDQKFLTSEKAKARKAVEIAETEQVIKELEKRQSDLLAEFEGKSLTDEQIEGITAFALQVANDMATLREAEAKGKDMPELKAAVYEEKRKLLALLDVQVTLFVKDGKKKARIVAKYCPDGEELSLSNGLQKVRNSTTNYILDIEIALE